MRASRRPAFADSPTCPADEPACCLHGIRVPAPSSRTLRPNATPRRWGAGRGEDLALLGPLAPSVHLAQRRVEDHALGAPPGGQRHAKDGRDKPASRDHRDRVTATGRWVTGTFPPKAAPRRATKCGPRRRSPSFARTARARPRDDPPRAPAQAARRTPGTAAAYRRLRRTAPRTPRACRRDPLRRGVQHQSTTRRDAGQVRRSAGSVMSASMSSTSRSTANGGVSPLSPRPWRA
jgi:hypothetical protein